MKRRVEMSVARLIWLCAISGVIGMNLTVLIFQISRGETVLAPTLGILAVVLVIASDIAARRKPAGS